MARKLIGFTSAVQGTGDPLEGEYNVEDGKLVHRIHGVGLSVHNVFVVDIPNDARVVGITYDEQGDYDVLVWEMDYDEDVGGIVADEDNDDE